jgi:hypothetical protein
MLASCGLFRRREPPREKPNEIPQTVRRVARAVNAVTPDIPSLTAILPFTGTHACIAMVGVLILSFSLSALICVPG